MAANGFSKYVISIFIGDPTVSKHVNCLGLENSYNFKYLNNQIQLVFEVGIDTELCSNNDLRLYGFKNLFGFSESFAGDFGICAQFFFNAENLIVCSQTFKAARVISINLTSLQNNNQINNEGILRIHGTPIILFGQQMYLDRFCGCAELVDLQQKTVAGQSNHYQRFECL